MRTSLGDHLVALRRPAALAALAAAAGGVVALLAPRMGLWVLTAEVQALDTVGRQAVTTLPGSEASPATWAVAALGAVVVVVALLVALDRPPPRADAVLFTCGTALLGLTGALLALRPGTESFAGRPGAADLVAGPVLLPTGVGIELSVTPGGGLWVLAAGGLLVLGGTVVALRRG